MGRRHSGTHPPRDPAATRRCAPVLLLVLAFAPAACGPHPTPPPPPPDVGYVDWLSREAWDLSDLAAVAASADQLCRRAGEGDESERRLFAEASTSLWLVRAFLLPALRGLPDAGDVPADAIFDVACPLAPDQVLASAVQEFLLDPDRAHATEKLLAVETQGGTRHVADDARFARVLLAVGMLLPAADVGPTPSLVDAAIVLDPDGQLLVGPEQAGGSCAAEPTSPACLWERLAVQALLDTSGADAVDRSQLRPEALGTLARRGLLDLVARALLPIVEDPWSTLHRLAGTLVERLGRSLNVEQAAGEDLEGSGEESWPEAAP
jgi:hypothetical protein